ncbi:MAG: hypothetical protein JNM27_17015 [Leptospirales bacterium]|nr:hypothetical protein [Leptospirales bacterium]
MRTGHLFLKAIHAVSTSHPMPRYEEYRARDAQLTLNATLFNPKDADLLLQYLQDLPQLDLSQRLVWTSSPVSSRRLASYIISFVDDYRGSAPEEFFPWDRLSLLFAALANGDTPMPLPFQLRLALHHADQNLLSALVLIHSASRIIARGRDYRILPVPLHFSLEARLLFAARFAPFDSEISQGGDILGDTYHYWAMLLAGFFFWSPATFSLIPYRPLFMLAPDLMRIVRQGIFRSYLFNGNHKTIDKLGLRHGRIIGIQSRRTHGA